MHEVKQLLKLVARLRDPDHGCPWDRAQSYASIAPYTIEEAYELNRALKLQRKAAAVGFDWSEPSLVLDKIVEETTELRAELAAATAERLLDELGDLLFACVNLARHLSVDPEIALRRANVKFERRFQRIEAWLAQTGRAPAQATPAEWDALWERAKAAERDSSQAHA